VEARKVDNIRRRSSRRTAQVVRQKPKRRGRSLSWLWLGLTGVGLVSGGGGALLAMSLSSTPFLQKPLSAVEAAIFSRKDNAFSRSVFQVPEVTKPVNILVLGIKTNLSDMRTGEGTERKQAGYDAESDTLQGLSDTMMLIRFDPVSKRVVMLGIPRDTKVEVGGRSVKINSIDQESGVGQAAKVVSDTLQGVEIDRYVRLNNFGLEKLIDSLGGLTLTVPKDIKYQDDSQHFYINLKAGKQHLDGKKLIGYIRFRKDANGDIGRMQRQQTVMRSMLEQWVNPINVARIPELMSIVRTHVDTNLNVEEIIALGGFASGPAKGKMQTLMLPGDYNGDGKHSISYWLADEMGIKNMMARYFDHGQVDELPSNPENLRIKIQDTTYFPDATQRFVNSLTKKGYQNVHLDKDPKALKEDLATTQIIVQRGSAASGEAIREKLGFGTVEVNTSGDLYSDITIKLGRDWGQRK
jgi:polyisoprenyl-teichoic acid--peptidoglycan teichoic acid transferase